MALTARRIELAESGLGASEVSTAIGLNPWQSPAELRAVKRHEMEPFKGNMFTHFGEALEAVNVAEWLRRHREAGENVSIFTPPTIVHARSPYLFATADRIVVPVGRRARAEWKALVEAKNRGQYRKQEYGDSPDEIPEADIVQVQAQLECLDLPKGWLVALFGGNDWREYCVVRDREMGRQLVAFAEQWWRRHVVEGQPVSMDGSDASTDYLRRRYPRENAPLLEATPELKELVQMVRLSREALKESETAEAECSNKLKAALGEAAGVEGLCSFKQNKDSTKVDWQAVVDDIQKAYRLRLGDEADRILEAALATFTTIKPGARQLRLAKEK